MPLFSSLRARSASDEKDHDSDSESNNHEVEMSSHRSQLTPLMMDPAASNGDSDSFSLRVKLNDGKSTVDFTLEKMLPNATVRKLKERILERHFNGADDGSGDGSLRSPPRRRGGSTTNGNANCSNSNANNRYLRLIVRGRMMAPDTSRLETFSVVANDVIHAVLAKEGARGGQQARMLRRMNYEGRGSGGGAGGSNTSLSGRDPDQTLWRRIGIDANGVVVPHNENDESDDDTSEGSEFEDAHGEIDLEVGHQGGGESSVVQSRERGGGRRRRRRERRGFDRLRSTGMTRDEVTAIRLYFARSVDRYIERRRVMIRASRRLRESLNDIVNAGIDGGDGGAGNNPGLGSQSRQRSDTGESSNSLLEDESNNSNSANNIAEAGDDVEAGNSEGVNDSESGDNNGSGDSEPNIESSFEGEEILNDRLRMEDEWMSTQGPYSEFRMNLNTSNPLLLAAITGGTDGAAAAPRTPAGLFFRSRNGAGGLGDPDDDDDEMFGGAFAPSGAFLRIPSGAGFPPNMGPLPSAGTDKDFVWGFVLGFFVGFIMLFWVWMPTVPHKQKIGIMSGISFQLGLNLLRKSGQGQSGVAAI